MDGKKIFKTDENKFRFHELVKENQSKSRIRIFAYCIMNNHYHLIVENSSGQMSQFFKQLNGQYGAYHRGEVGGKGYVFQDRFKSVLIQNESYLKQVIAYTLNNPVRAGICDNAAEYTWSSAAGYFTPNHTDEIVDNRFVSELFGDKDSFEYMLATSEEPVVLKTRSGLIIGNKDYYKTALRKFNRRKGNESIERNRRLDRYFEPVEKLIREFEQKHGICLEEIDTATHAGKRLRGELLMRLKDDCGLTYSEIGKMDIFCDVQVSSLGRLYQYAKKLKH